MSRLHTIRTVSAFLVLASIYVGHMRSVALNSTRMRIWTLLWAVALVLSIVADRRWDFRHWRISWCDIPQLINSLALTLMADMCCWVDSRLTVVPSVVILVGCLWMVVVTMIRVERFLRSDLVASNS